MPDHDAVKIAKALADPTRLLLVQRLRRRGEMTCSDACKLCEQSQPTVSHHIKTLVNAGVIAVRKEGAFHLLSLNSDAMAWFASMVSGGRTAKTRRARVKSS